MLTRRRFVRSGIGSAAAWALAKVPLQASRQPLPSGAARAVAERHREDLVALLSSLIAVRSHSGESAEQAQAIVSAYLSRLPFRVESSADDPSRLAEHAEFMPPNPPGNGPFVNLIARPASARASRVALFAHVDTEPPGEGWITDPYRASVAGGRLTGLGAADDKGGLAAMLVAASALHETGGPLPVVMSLHGKGGGSRGSLPVFSRIEKLDAVLYVHPAETGRGLADIKHVVRGALDVAITVQGWRGTPLEIGSPESAPYGEGGSALDACWRAVDHLRATALEGCEVNVGQLQGGDRIGAVPERAEARVRILFDEPHAWKDVLARSRRELDAFLGALPGGRGTFRGAIEPVGLRTNPGEVDWDSRHCRALRAAIRDVTGREPASYRNHYAGDIRYPIRLLGAPAFGIGSVGGNFYGPNEWVDLDDLVRLVAVVVDTAVRWTNLAA